MATTEYHWPDTRNKAIQAFNGDTPGDQIETAILTHFQEHPNRVNTLIDAIGRRVAQGQVRSGWAILHHELEHAPTDITATDNRERANQLRLAETWIRNTGGYIDRQTELEDELFGDRGRLRHWPELRDQTIACWLEQRHRFEAAEREAEERGRRNAATLERIRRHTTSPTNPEADKHAERITAEVERARNAQLARTAAASGDIDWTTP